MLGGSKRSIIKDRWPSPEQVAMDLRQEQAEPKRRIPWLAYFAVSMEGTMVPSTLPRPELVRRLAEMGDIAGLLGVILFGNQFRIYTRRFLLDPLAQKRLDKAAKLYTEHFKNFEAEELRRRTKDATEAQLSAQVYLDPGGKTMSMYYSFHPQHLPEPGSTRVGTVYLVDAEKARGHYDAKKGWAVRWHAEDPHSSEHAEILKQATRRFNEVIKKLQEMQNVEVAKR